MSGKHRHRRREEQLEARLSDNTCSTPTTHEEVKELAYRKFHVGADSVVCGYLRQPIRLQEGFYDVVVDGYCTLKDNHCEYSVTQNRLYQIGTCETYRKRFG